MLNCNQLKKMYEDCEKQTIKKRNDYGVEREVINDVKLYNCVILAKDIYLNCNKDVFFKK